MKTTTRAFLFTALCSAVGSQGSCVWTACANSLASTSLWACPSGYSYHGQTRDCGSQTCVFGVCWYTNSEHMCCPSNCNWWDVNCNWPTIQGYFQSTTNSIKTAWSQLSHSVQDKLTTAAKFATLLDSELLSLPSELLSELKSVSSMTLHQFQIAAGKVNQMTSTHLQHFLDNVAPNALSDGIATLGNLAQTWTTSQVTMIKNKLSSSTMWGAIANWNSSRVSALGTMIANFDVQSLISMSDNALASASNVVQLSANTLTALAGKLGNMQISNFQTALNNLNSTAIFSAMLSQCNIQCQNDPAMAFLNNPSWATTQSALDAFAQTVMQKAHGAAVAYAQGFCYAGGLGATNYTSIARNTYASLQAAAIPCTGSAAVNNAVSTTFGQWSNSQAGLLINRLTGGNALGPLAAWSNSQISAMCNQYAALTPSNIAMMLATNIVSTAGSAAMSAASTAVFGPLGAPVANYAIAQTANLISPQQRAAWAAQFKAGLGSVAGWGCAQVASLQTMVSGLQAADLSAIPVSSIVGLAANAITAMSAGQVQGFSPQQFTAMADDVRKRVFGNLLGGLSSSQMIAAVCGNLNAGSSSCPSAVVDLAMAFPSGATPSQNAIVQHFVNSVPNVAASSVQVLWTAPTQNLPSTGTSPSGSGGRRLTATSTQVAVRIGVSQHSQTAATTTSANSAATSLVAGGGSVVQTAVGYAVTPTTTTGPPVVNGAPTFWPRLAALLASVGAHVLLMSLACH